MPYIKDFERSRFSDTLKLLRENVSFNGLNSGQLNYLITNICHIYMHHNGTRYREYNDVIGALEAAKLEFYRRQIVPYEDKKLEENGDVG